MVKMVQQRQNNAQDGKSESPEENKSFVTSKTTINITNMKKQGQKKQPSPQRDEKINEEEEKLQELGTVNLIEWTYDYFMHRYGLKNVADKKFKQFIGSIIKYRQTNSRFHLIGRFLELYEELNEVNLKLYFEIVQNMGKSILNFNI